MHLWPLGGHVFGTRPGETGEPVTWADRLEDWLRAGGWLSLPARPSGSAGVKSHGKSGTSPDEKRVTTPRPALQAIARRGPAGNLQSRRRRLGGWRRTRVMKTGTGLSIATFLSFLFFPLPEATAVTNYFINPPPQTDPIIVSLTTTTGFLDHYDKNQDVRIEIEADQVGNIYVNGGRHIRVMGNGHRMSGVVRLMNGGGTSGNSGTMGIDDVGDPGSLYVEGIYFPKESYPPGTTGSRQDCVIAYNNPGYGDGRKISCVIIQRCRATGIFGSNASDGIGHGDFFQVQGVNDPLDLGYTYISGCTIETGFTGFQYYQARPGGDGTLKDNPRMRLVNTNWKRHWYTDQSKSWCNVNPDGTPRGGNYFALGLDRHPESQPGPGLHFAVLETYAERNMRNGVEKVMFNPNNNDARNLVYEYEAAGTKVINDRATGQKSVFMAGAVIIGAPPGGDFMPESAFIPATWRNIGVSGGPSFYANYQEGRLPEELGIPFSSATAGSAEPGRLGNLSVRTYSGAGDQVLNVGFALGGAATAGTRPLLVRVNGPALIPFGVDGTMLDPTLVLRPLGSAVVLAANDNWAGDAPVASTADSVGAFPATDPGSKDAAVVSTLSAGTYTIVTEGVNAGTGIVLAEIYDADRTGGQATPRLVNVSARAHVGTGDHVLIAGFVVLGGTRKTLLVRATGPALAAYGVSDTLADPQLEIAPLGGANLSENDNWGGASELVTAGNSVGAFPILDASSKDAVVLLTLPPGGYTAKVSGVGGGTGVALVEVYEVP